MDRRSVAVIGAGVSGLTAAYLLQQRYDVTLYEAEPRLGGHAHTHDVLTPDERVIPIDSGFIVHNDATYPNLLRLFAELGVETRPTDMSMSVRCEVCGLEDAGARGTSLLLVERGMAGFEKGKRLKKLGLRAQDTSELFFDNVRVPSDMLLGGPAMVCKGFVCLMEEVPWDRR